MNAADRIRASLAECEAGGGDVATTWYGYVRLEDVRELVADEGTATAIAVGQLELRTFREIKWLWDEIAALRDELHDHARAS